MIVRANRKTRARSPINFQSVLFTTTFILLALFTIPDGNNGNENSAPVSASIANAESSAEIITPKF